MYEGLKGLLYGSQYRKFIDQEMGEIEKKAIPFGLQHVLAMFVSNLAPVLIVCSAALVRGTGEHLTSAEITQLLQCAMFVAGIGTCMQLYPVWKIGSGLPIVMGVIYIHSFLLFSVLVWREFCSLNIVRIRLCSRRGKHGRQLVEMPIIYGITLLL